MTCEMPAVITVEGQLALRHPSGHTLLSALHAARVPVQAHCKEGVCGACRTPLIHGQVRYREPPLACLNDNEILPCCCEPVGDITIAVSG